MKSLQEFYQDKETRENVRLYLLEFIEKEAVRMLFDREDTKGVADAKEMIDKAWSNLDLLFQQQPVKNTINEAR